MDFTFQKYCELLFSLKKAGYRFSTFDLFDPAEAGKVVILRHDVDRKPGNAVTMARLENRFDTRASYHFRVFDHRIDGSEIREIVSLGHEVAYHYEDLSAVAAGRGKKERHSSTLFELAHDRFISNLGKLRNFYPVKVISMHGSPLSRYDNRKLWKYYNYRDQGIVCEPYFDIDMTVVLYLTDTGRSWNVGRSNIRDRAIPAGTNLAGSLCRYDGWIVQPLKNSAMDMTEVSSEFQSSYRFNKTDDIIKSIADGNIPEKIIISTHPQRWTSGGLQWFKELVFQNLKNIIKVLLSGLRNTG